MKNILLGLLLMALGTAASAVPPAQGGFSFADTVVRVPLAEDVGAEDAVDSMKLRANTLNMMFVAHQPLSKQIEAMGVDTRHIEIFQFCDPLIAGEMVKKDIIFAAYMPCRIAMVEDDSGQLWLVMMDLDFFLQAAKLTPELAKVGMEVRDKLMSIIEAGANGDL